MKHLSAILIFSASLLFAQENEYTLDRSLEVGLKNSTEIKIAESVVKSSEALAGEYNSRMLPKLTAGGGYYWLSNPPVKLDLPFPVPDENGPVNAAMLNVSLEQPLFTGFRLSSIKSSAELTHEADKLDKMKTVNDKAMEIHRAFWVLYKAGRFEKLLQENLESINEHLRNTAEFYSNGLVTSADVLGLKVKAAETELKLLEAENNTKTARAFFNKSVGLPLSNVTTITAPPLEGYTGLEDYNSYLEEALANREELRALGLRKEAGQEMVSAAKGNWYPQFNAFGSFYLLNIDGAGLPIKTDPGNFFVVGLGMKWDIWDWGNRSDKTEQAEQKVFQAGLMIRQVKEAVEAEVYRNYLEAESGKAKIETSRKAVLAATENLRVVKEKYSQQAVTSTELTDAEVALLTAKTSLANSVADYHVATALLNKSAGRKIYSEHVQH